MVTQPKTIVKPQSEYLLLYVIFHEHSV